MKFVTVILILVPFTNWGQGFNLRYDFQAGQDGEAMWNIELLDDGYLIVQTASDPNSIFVNFGIKKLDYDGDVAFENLFLIDSITTYAGWANSATLLDTALVLGTSSHPYFGYGAFELVLFSLDGDTIWTRVYPNISDSATSIGRCAIQTPDGGYLLAGETNENGTTDGLLIKTDENGNELWREFYGGDEYNALVSAVNAQSGGILAGGTRNDGNSENIWLVKTNSTGEILWENEYGDLGFDDNLAHLCANGDGTYLVASGIAVDDNSTFSDTYPYVLKINEDGGIVWEKTYGNHYWDEGFTSIKKVPEGGYIAAGISTASVVDYEGLLLRIASNGDSLWMRRYHWLEGNNCFFRDVIPSENGGFVACGLAYPDSEMGLSLDGWVVKTDEYGCVIPGCNVGIVEQDEIADFLIYPNPASTVTNIYLQTKDIGLRGEFVLRDLAGRELVRHATLGGDINIGMDVSRYQAGMYVVEFVVEGRILKTEKLLVE